MASKRLAGFYQILRNVPVQTTPRCNIQFPAINNTDICSGVLKSYVVINLQILCNVCYSNIIQNMKGHGGRTKSATVFGLVETINKMLKPNMKSL